MSEEQFGNLSVAEKKRLHLEVGDVSARSDGKETLLVTEADAKRLHLEMAEDGRDLSIVRAGEVHAARGGYAREKQDEPTPHPIRVPAFYHLVYEVETPPK